MAQKNITERQLEIIEASGKILMEKGILGLTTKNLAKEMHFSESALYRHFKDKEAIISHLIAHLSENITHRFDNILKSNLNPEEKLVELFKSQFRFFKSNPHFIVIVLSDGLMDNSQEIKEAIFQLIQTNTKTIKQIIEDGQKSKIFNTEIDGEYLVHFVMGSFRLQMLKWKLSNFSFDIEKQGINTMINLLKLLKK
ncbi:MAG: TetR/AcrR family transcriptional regulator [Bacteroidetes bacterium]|nr:TetR/AcrR family transcriptional regulator [Bacteroidota bacterium]MBK9634287.1 TetR/AcrR family transcriptional regulator [Bacteroidota bacterium]